MEAKPLISIITVVYNGVQYLEETIKSVLSQNYSNLEYLIIDGGSTDGTVDIIKKYESELAFWISEKDKGMYDAINKGINYSNGVLWMSLNADDRFVSKDIVSTVVETYQGRDKEFVAYFGDLVKEREGKRRTINLFPVSFESLLSSGHCTFMPQPTTFVCRAVTEKVGLFDTNYRYASDYDYHLRLLYNGSAKHIGKPFTIFLQHEEALTSTSSGKMDQERRTIIKHHESSFAKLWLRPFLFLFFWGRYAFLNKIKK